MHNNKLYIILIIKEDEIQTDHDVARIKSFTLSRQDCNDIVQGVCINDKVKNI